MPRQITDLAINAFMNGKNFKQKNTTVGNIDTVTTDLYYRSVTRATKKDRKGEYIEYSFSYKIDSFIMPKF